MPTPHEATALLLLLDKFEQRIPRAIRDLIATYINDVDEAHLQAEITPGPYHPLIQNGGQWMIFAYGLPNHPVIAIVPNTYHDQPSGRGQPAPEHQREGNAYLLATAATAIAGAAAELRQDVLQLAHRLGPATIAGLVRLTTTLDEQWASLAADPSGPAAATVKETIHRLAAALQGQ